MSNQPRSVASLVWCVAYWIDDKRGGEIGWCATRDSAEPDPDEFNDATECGYHVMMRIDAAKRIPTCITCREIVRTWRSGDYVAEG